MNAIPPNHNSMAAELDAADAGKYAAVVDEWQAQGVADELAAARLRDLQAQLTRLHKQLDEQRAAEKEPHARAAKAIDDKYRPVLAIYDACKKRVGILLAGWLRKEQDRLAQERAAAEAEARRLAEEARRAAAEAEKSTMAAIDAERAIRAAEDASKAAALAASARPQVASAHGAARRATLRTSWHAKVASFGPAVKSYWGHADVVAVLEKLASADARAGKRQIAGFIIESKETVA